MYYLSLLGLIVIAQWIGVYGLLKHGRNGSWWWMLAGTSVTTMGAVSLALIYVIGRFTGIPNWGEIHTILMTGYGYLPPAGSLFFALGFAIHGSRLARHRERITELEMMNLAQATELERLQNR